MRSHITQQDAEIIKNLTSLVERAKRGSQNIHIFNAELVIDADVVVTTGGGYAGNQRQQVSKNLQGTSVETTPSEGMADRKLRKPDEFRRGYSVGAQSMDTDRDVPTPDASKLRPPDISVHNPKAVSFSDQAYHPEFLSMGTGDMNKFVNSPVYGRVGSQHGYEGRSPEEREQSAELIELLRGFLERIESSPDIDKYDKMTARKATHDIEEAVNNPQSEEAKEHAEHAVDSLKKMGNRLQDAIGLSADLTAIVPLIFAVSKKAAKYISLFLIA